MRFRPIRPRVLQLITTLDPGGAEHQLLVLVKRLRPRFRPVVAYFKGAGRLAHAFHALEIPVRDLGIRSRADVACLGRLRRLVRELEPDLVVTHLFKADLYGRLAADSRIPVVSHKHNQDHYLRHPFFGALARAAVSDADRHIAVSDAVRRFYVDQAGFPDSRFCTVRHGIEPRPDSGPLDPVRTEPWPARPSAAPRIGTAARLTPQKGLTTLLHAVARLRPGFPGLVCAIAGQGEDEASLRALARNLGVEDRVQFLGQVTDIPAFLRTLDVFVLPSRWEGFGLVLLEAMAEARAVVATRVGGIPEVVRHGRTGLLVRPDDPEALARNLAAVLKNHDLRRNLGLAGHEACRLQFSAHRMAGEIATVYEDVIRERGRE